MCGCGCNNCHGLMGLLGSLLPAGSQVKTGFQVSLDWSMFGSQASAADISNVIEGCVYTTGGFDAVSVDVQGSYFSNSAYITVAVQTVNDHADIEDVGNWIQGQIQTCLPDIQIVRRDATVGIGQTDSVGNPLPQGNQRKDDTPAKCDWSKLKWSDWLACEMGITPSSAALVGAVAGIGGVFLILTLAKR
jgi:hypothetical protein